MGMQDCGHGGGVGSPLSSKLISNGRLRKKLASKVVPHQGNILEGKEESSSIGSGLVFIFVWMSTHSTSCKLFRYIVLLKYER